MPLCTRTNELLKKLTVISDIINVSILYEIRDNFLERGFMLDEYKDIIKNNKFRFDNYRVACKELGEKIRGGTSKISQLEDWNRYFTFHKDGNAIVVDVIRDVPLPLINKRRKIKGKWTMLIQSILYDAFSKQKEETGDYEIKGTRRDYLRLLGLCSSFYLEARYKSLSDVISEMEDGAFKDNLVSYLEAYHITDDVWLDFCIEVEKVFTNIISNAFKSLESHNIIRSDKDTYVIIREKYSKNGESYFVKEYATEKEKELIERISRKLAEVLTDDDDSIRLKSLTTKSGKRKFSDTQIMYILNYFKDYQSELNDTLRSALDCVYVYRLTTIDVGSEADMNMIGEIDFDRAMTRMMDKTCTKIYSNIETLCEKYKIEEETKIQYLVLLQEVVRDKEVLDDDMYSAIGEMYFF